MGCPGPWCPGSGGMLEVMGVLGTPGHGVKSEHHHWWEAGEVSLWFTAVDLVENMVLIETEQEQRMKSVFRIIESWWDLCWKRSLSPLSPNINPALPCSPLNHGHRCLSNTSRSGDSTTALGSPFLSSLQMKTFSLILNQNLLWHNFEAVSLCPVAYSLGEKTNPHPATTSLQEVSFPFFFLQDNPLTLITKLIVLFRTSSVP